MAEAGWAPITNARSNDPRVYVERFGERYLTVFNDGEAERSVVLTWDGEAPGQAVELLSGTTVAWRPVQNAAGTRFEATIALRAEEVAVIRLR